jgi:hypothetical protein
MAQRRSLYLDGKLLRIEVVTLWVWCSLVMHVSACVRAYVRAGESKGVYLSDGPECWNGQMAQRQSTPLGI